MVLINTKIWVILMSKELAIKVCLERIKRCLSSGNVLFINRSKNLQTMFQLGLSLKNVYEQLLKLRPVAYHSGPLADKDASEGQIWVFFHPVKNTTIYIKLKFFESHGSDWLKIISFHEQEIGL